jgi:hypothetical protein
VLNINLSDFMIELKDGAIQNVGPSNKQAEAKLFDVEAAEAREFGDKRVKLVFEDDDGNEVQAALFPEDARAVREDLDALEAESRVFE